MPHEQSEVYFEKNLHDIEIEALNIQKQSPFSKVFSFFFFTAAKLKLIRTDILSGSPVSCYDWPEGFSTHYTSCGAFDIQAGGDKVNYDDEGKDIEWGPRR